MTIFIGQIRRMAFVAIVFGILHAPAVAGSPGWDALNAGIAHNGAGQYEQAIADFTTAIAAGDLSQTNQVRAMYNRGVSYDSLGRTDDAIAAYGEALRLKPDFSPALNNRANAYRRLGRLDEAQQDYWSALAVQGAAAEYSYYGLGMIAQTRGNDEVALGFFNRALSIAPDFELARTAVRQLGPLKTKKSRPANDPPKTKAPDTPAAAAISEAPTLRLGPAERAADERANRAVADREESREKTAGVYVQVGSYPKRAAAEADWKRLQKKAPGVLAGYTPVIVSADLPDIGRVFRIRVSASRSEASKLCEALTVKKLGCLIIKD